MRISFKIKIDQSLMKLFQKSKLGPTNREKINSGPADLSSPPGLRSKDKQIYAYLGDLPSRGYRVQYRLRFIDVSYWNSLV